MKSPQTKYKRVMLKVSGEAFAGDDAEERGIDGKFAAWLAGQLKAATEQGVQVCMVVGGSNFVKGAEFNVEGLKRTTADYMGMLGGVINGMAIRDLLEHNGQTTRLMRQITIDDRFGEPLVRAQAIKHMERGSVVIFTGGIGRPYVTHDTAAVSIGLEMGCDIVAKVTQIDGVYDKDPNKHDDAKLFEELDFPTAISDPGIRVMDKAALGLAYENDMPIAVFNMHKDGNIAKFVAGERVGTLVS